MLLYFLFLVATKIMEAVAILEIPSATCLYLIPRAVYLAQLFRQMEPLFVRATSGTFTVSSDIDSLGNFNFRGLEYGSYLIQPYPTAGYLISGGILVLVLAPAPNITLFTNKFAA